MKEVESRWQQRFGNYSRALQVLERGVASRASASSPSWSSRG